VSKKRKKRKATSKANGKKVHSTDPKKAGELDHTAHHLAEDLRNATRQWEINGFSFVDLERLPPVSRPYLQDRRDWMLLTQYIEKWLKWWLLEDRSTPVIHGQPMACGEIVANLKRRDNGQYFIVFGYQIQSAASQN
jgi:hypothetical protein